MFFGFHQARSTEISHGLLMGHSQSPDPLTLVFSHEVMVFLTPFGASQAYDAAARGDFSITHSLYQLFLRRLDWKLELGFVFDKGSPGAVERCIYSKYSKQNREEYVYIYITKGNHETILRSLDA